MVEQMEIPAEMTLEQIKEYHSRVPDPDDKEFSDEEGDRFESLLGQIYIHVLNKELEKQKEESEDGTTRRYDFAKPVI